MMKHFYNKLATVAIALMAMLTACNNEDQLYNGPSYVMFADTLNVCPVYQDGEAYQVAVSATRTASYDRNFGVEVLHTKSNAVEGVHYTLSSNTVTIPAGELAASIEVKGIYENIEESDSLNLRLRLVALDEELEWDYYGLEANVSFRKICPFDINNFTRYAVVQSTFFKQFDPYGDPARLIMTERVEGEENTVILHDFFADGYDVQLTLDNEDPLTPLASVREGDIVGTTQEFLMTTYGDNMLRIANYTAINSTFNTCKNQATLYSLIYVDKVGYVGAYATVVRWISDDEANDILNNGF